MGHPIETKESAFRLYCDGYSFDRIAEMLGEKDIRVTKRTLIKWQEEYGWKARRQKILADVRSKSDESQTTKLAKVGVMIDELEGDIYEELKNTPLKSKEGGVTALRQLQEMRQRLLGDKRFEEQIDEIIGIIFGIFAEDEKIGPMLPDRQHILVEKLEKVLKEKYGIS